MVNLGSLAGAMGGGASVNIVVRAIDQFSGTLTKAKVGVSSLGKSATLGAAGMATLGVAVAAVATAVAVKGVKAFANFETGIRNVQTLMKEGDDAMEIFGDDIQDMAKKMAIAGGTASLTAGLYQTMSAGVTDAADAMYVLELATESAIGGSAELPDVINAVTKTMNAYGMAIKDTGHVLDVFAAVVQAGITTMPELAAAFPIMTGSAAELGVSFEELSGVFAGLTKVLQSPRRAAQSLDSIMRVMNDPTDKLRETMDSLGFSSVSMALKQYDLMTILQMLKDEVGGDSEAMAEMFGNAQALRGVFPALGTASEHVASSMEAINDSTGLAKKQFEDMNNTTTSLGTRMKNNIGVAMEKIGEGLVKVGKVAVEVLGPAFRELWDAMKEFSKTEAFQAFIKYLAYGFKTLGIVIGGVIWILVKALTYLIKWWTWVAEKLKPVFEFISWVLDKISQAYAYLKEKFVDAEEGVGELANSTDELAAANENLASSTVPAAAGVAVVNDIIVDLDGNIVQATSDAKGLVEQLGALASMGLADPSSYVRGGILPAAVQKYYADFAGVAERGGSSLVKGPVRRAKDARGAGAPSPNVGLGSVKGYFHDFVMRPGQAPVSFSPNDTIIGTKNGGGLGGPTIVINITDGTIVGERAARELADTISTQFSNKLSSQWSVGIG